MEPEPLDALIDRALEEDVGAGDVTTEATVAIAARARATITQKQSGVIYGLHVAEAVFRRLDPEAAIERLGREGVWNEPPTPVLGVTGSARALLTAERTALNFLQRLSGVATESARAVAMVREAGGSALVLDTRKTTPGLRVLEKAAVAAGGANNHRAGLYDAFLIKENHIALAGGISRAVRAARGADPDLAVEVEVRDRHEIEEALEAGADRLLLDNMDPEEVRAAVALVGGRAILEASGGIDVASILVYATIDGLDYVSVGALTHSAPALDLSLALEASP
ncbi:MAG: carboxylating nicotinate-nucleotide diphosphorylase [Solirubrobacterales bacterium]|nr:carboxylating nicotinate-nucleotide diphosphorylase [Solirubrobacterales bacterium]